ncbi:UDP-glucose 4-epimerase GalE [Paenibacillus sp. CAU 1782]
MKILVTGGLGYIGSHTVIELIKNHHTVIIVDNLSNSSIGVLDRIVQITTIEPKFFQIDVTNEQCMDQLFESEQIDGVIHFAGFKAVGESVNIPLDYYYNNILTTLVLTKLCLKYDVNRFVFSSSATVYGPNQSPLHEEMTLFPTTNPYGESKVINERILTDYVTAYPTMSVTILRYFNPVGAHESGLIGESPTGKPNNLMPYITAVATGEYEKLFIYGDDYNTADGTGIRDYIHVVDLAKAHVQAIEKIKTGLEIFNLGTGKGTSVLEMINIFEQVSQISIPYQIVDRRPGDLDNCFADVNKAKQKLDWMALRTVEDMVRDSWRYAQRKVGETV